MKQWLQENIWWLGLVIAVVIALFPTRLALVGNLLVKYLPDYWLPCSIVLIVVLLIIILHRIGRKDDHDV